MTWPTNKPASGIPRKGAGWGGPAKGKPEHKPIHTNPPFTPEVAKLCRALANTADAKARRAAREQAQAMLESRAVEICMTEEPAAAANLIPKAHLMVGGAVKQEFSGPDGGPMELVHAERSPAAIVAQHVAKRKPASD